MTTKPTSTISYNSEPFLSDLLRRYFNAGVLKDYRYIFHYGEDGDKDHFHVWLEPNKRIDEALFRKEFDEFDPSSDKPLGALPFRASKGDNWIMYVLHDDEYLKSHNSQSDDGKIPYGLEDIKTPFPQQLQRDYKRALVLRQTETQKVINAMAQGASNMDILCAHNVNPNAVVAIRRLREQDSVSDDREVRQNNIKDALLASNKALTRQNAELLERLRTLEAMSGLDPNSIDF